MPVLWIHRVRVMATFAMLPALHTGGVALADTVQYRHAAEPIGSIRQVYDGKLYPDLQVNTFRNIDRLFPTRTVKRGPKVSALPVSDLPFEDFSFVSEGRTYDLYDVLSLNRVSGLLIIRDGEIRFEKYLLGNDENTRWMSMSVVKSMTATLIGAAIRDGYIKGLDEPVVRYLPRFRGTAYDGVTVRQILQMASGVAWNETYTDPASDRRAMLEAPTKEQLRVERLTGVKGLSRIEQWLSAENFTPEGQQKQRLEALRK